MQESAELSSIIAYASSLLRSGGTTERVRADLLGRDIDQKKADWIIAEAIAGNRRQGLSRGVLYLAIGIVCSVLGIGITGATYSAATQNGGTYFITIGLFGFGLGYTIGGIIRIIAAASTGK